MAISVAKQYYSELNSIADPLRILQSIEYSTQDQMELGINTIDENISRNIYGSHTNELQDYVDHTINFGNTKDCWSTDFTKYMLDSATIERDTIPTGLRKRRMDWDSIDLNVSNNNGGVGPTESKMSTMTNVKDRERRKTATSSNSGRLGWTDDIDFDLPGELTNNGYLNNEALLSLSTALTTLKHEISSPSTDQQKNIKDRESHQDQQLIQNGGHIVKMISAGNVDNSNSNSNSNGSLEQHNKCHILEQTSNFVCESPPHEQRCVQPIGEQSKFQYVLAASTSIATKSNEDTLTYLNQGQSYEIKLKKLGDLSTYRGKVLKSVIKICFHERRLQYMEKEQMFQWQNSRPGERIVEIDVPLSYGLCQVAQSNCPKMMNTVEVLWDPMKEVGVYIQVNCISTEFTPKKHGGEKGVPFRIQVETYLENVSGPSMALATSAAAATAPLSVGGMPGGVANNADAGTGSLKLIHAAACQIKVFKLKGADRKHKQDREKIQKRTPTEQEKYQPSYECTILTDIPIDSIAPQGGYTPEHVTGRSGNTSPLKVQSPPVPIVNKFESVMFNTTVNNPIGINSVSSSNSNLKIDQNTMSPQQVEADESPPNIVKDSTPSQLTKWMNHHRLGQHISTFTHFTGADLLRMSKEDIIHICGIADGIRMYNTIHLKAITPRLTIYVSLDGNSYHAIYLHATNTLELAQKLSKLPGFFEICNNTGPNGKNAHYIYDANKLSVYVHGPAGIHVLVTDEVLNNIKDDSLFVLDIKNAKVLMKAVYKNELN